jgi:hypothetical protein
MLKFDKEDYLCLLRARGFHAVDMKAPVAFINNRELVARPRRAVSLKGILSELDYLWKHGVRYIGVLKVCSLIDVWTRPGNAKEAEYFKNTMYLRTAYYADHGVPGDGKSRWPATKVTKAT